MSCQHDDTSPKNRLKIFENASLTNVMYPTTSNVQSLQEGGNLLPIAIQSEFCPEHDASGVSSHMHRGSVSSLILASYFAAWSTVKVSETPSQSTLFRFHGFGGSVTLRYCHFCLFHGILEISPKKSIGVAGKAYTLSKLIIRYCNFTNMAWSCGNLWR